MSAPTAPSHKHSKRTIPVRGPRTVGCRFNPDVEIRFESYEQPEEEAVIIAYSLGELEVAFKAERSGRHVINRKYPNPPTLPSGYGISQPPTVTVGCFGALALKFKLWFSKPAVGAPTEKTPIVTNDLYRERFSTSPTDWGEDDPRWGSFASETLRGFSDYRRRSLVE